MSRELPLVPSVVGFCGDCGHRFGGHLVCLHCGNVHHLLIDWAGRDAIRQRRVTVMRDRVMAGTPDSPLYEETT